MRYLKQNDVMAGLLPKVFELVVIARNIYVETSLVQDIAQGRNQLVIITAKQNSRRKIRKRSFHGDLCAHPENEQNNQRLRTGTA